MCYSLWCNVPTMLPAEGVPVRERRRIRVIQLPFLNVPKPKERQNEGCHYGSISVCMRIMSDTFSSGEISVDGDRDILHSSQCDVLFQVPRNSQNLFFFGTQ